MLKKTLYPKTKRMKNKADLVIATEKLDGSNLGFFNIDGRLLVAQRNTVFYWDKIKENGSQGLYKGLFEWLSNNSEELLGSIYLGSGVFGEWIGMGKIKYKDLLDGIRYHIFSKARIDEELNISNIVYDIDSINYAFNEQKIPSFLRKVNVVKSFDSYPSVEDLNSLYEDYTKETQRNVEGFVINSQNTIKKYVRMKNGKLSDHKQ